MRSSNTEIKGAPLFSRFVEQGGYLDLLSQS